MKYTTKNIVARMDINKERLCLWLKDGFIKPTFHSNGQGTKSYFTKLDLYCLKAFKDMVEGGHSRSLASKKVTLLKKVPIETKIVYFTHSWDNTLLKIYDSMEKASEEDFFMLSIFNYEKIKKSVDKLFPEENTCQKHQWILNIDKPPFCSLEMEVCPYKIKKLDIPGAFILKGFTKNHRGKDDYTAVTCFIDEDISEKVMPALKLRQWSHVQATIGQHRRKIYRKGKVITDVFGNDVLEDKIVFYITNVKC